MADAQVTFYPVGSAPAEMAPGDFLLIRNDEPWHSKNGFVSALIRLGELLKLRRAGVPKDTRRQMARWNHAVGVSTSGLVEALGAGVARSPFSRYTGSDFLYVHTDLTDAQRAEAAGYLESMVGVRYGYLTDVSIGLTALTGWKFVFMDRRQVICSGLVAAMLGTWCWRSCPAFVMPSDLAAYHGISTTRLLDP
ncbi:MAG TPA: hypothetical protein VFH70_11915 [Acidimicrobiales bacterium]|nr:hypothetical protein [Acidimicrobiales bacterium]